MLLGLHLSKNLQKYNDDGTTQKAYRVWFLSIEISVRFEPFELSDTINSHLKNRIFVFVKKNIFFIILLYLFFDANPNLKSVLVAHRGASPLVFEL